MTIQETIKVTCDNCGETRCFEDVILYRISGGMNKAVEGLATQGWLFERANDFALLRVLCKDCRVNSG